jgi:LytR cell envelope-related transcriptional attenuator
MAASTARRPLPALAFLLALSLLTALVWWRVIHRSDSANAALPTCTTSASPTVTVVPAAASVLVNVLNSTDTNGLAGKVTGLLATDGFKTGTPGNDSGPRSPVTGVAEIRFGPTGAAGAKLLSFYVPGAVLVPDTRADASVDLAIGAKYTAVASPTDVAKSLAAAKLSQAPAPAASGSGTAATSPKPTGSGAASSASSAGSASKSAKASSSASRTCTPAAS